MTPDTLDRFRGCLLGGAVGDALGAAVEFLSLDEIHARFGPDGIQDPAEAYGRVGAITDDTQMTLFTAEGLLQADDRLQRGIGHPANQLWAAYQRWLVTQGEPSPVRSDAQWVFVGELHRMPALHARRAPGNTCLSALREPKDESSLDAIAANDSKGCGGVMRAAPCGLVRPHWHKDGPLNVGIVAAGLTHGHPTGHLAAGALAVIIDALVAGRDLEAGCGEALVKIRDRDGAGETVAALDRALRLAKDGSRTGVPAELGQGWVAEEALAIAVYACLVYQWEFPRALRLAVNHSGDSDSTGAIAGNIAGAALGVDAIPSRWLETLELRDEIDRLARAMHRRFAEGERDVDWDLWSGLGERVRPPA